jgi:negative regulator of sigma E activity
VQFEEIDEFEGELRASLVREPAPASLKRKVMEKRQQNRAQFHLGRTAARQRSRMVWFERIAASLVVASVAASAVVGHYAIERRKGEEVKQQVFTALRITNHAFRVMNEQLEKRDGNSQ